MNIELQDIMQDVFINMSGGGTPVAECACGRTNFGRKSDCFDDGELERLEAKEKAEPDRFFGQEYDGVSIREVFGRTYVIDCPCRWEGRIAKGVIDGRDIIVAILTKYAEWQKKQLPAVDSQIAAIKGLDR